MFILVNKNFLASKIYEFDNFEESIKKLQQETILRDPEWCKNIYIVNFKKQNQIYTSDGNNIYLTDLSKQSEKTIIYTNKKIFFNKNEYWVEFSEETNDMNLVISEKKQQNVRFLNTTNDKFTSISEFEISPDNKFVNSCEREKIVNNDVNNAKLINEEKNDIKDEDKKKNDEKIKQIIDMIEEVNELYQKELLNMKKLQSNLKAYDNKLKKLEKTKKDDIINDIVRTQSEYRTWKKIKYGIKENADESEVLKPLEELDENINVEENSDSSIPILFLSKYKYMEKIQNNESIKKLLDEINQLDLNELYSNNFLPNDSIIQFCNKYMKLSKELHYHFDDHEWSYLENEMNLNSTNKLGSNVISSKKI